MDDDRGRLSVAPPSRTRAETTAAGAGALWGALCYSILWDGTPFGVDRRFVESVGGTIVLLPARLVLWGVHGAELLSDRTFDLSRTTWPLGLAIVGTGALLGVLVVLAVRGVGTLVR